MQYLRIYLFIIILLCGYATHAQTIIPGGFVSGTWDSIGSPYLLQGSVTVHEDSALFILPGVEVEMQNKYSGIYVEGYIQAIGVQSAPILFHGTSWHGITIDSARTYIGDSLRFKYCLFAGGEDSSVLAQGGAMDIIYTDSVSINYCSFQINWVKNQGGALYLSNSDILCRNTSFRDNHVEGGDSGAGGAIAISQSNPVFINVSFENNTADVAGAVYSYHSSPSFYYSTFVNNSCEKGNAGALYCADSGYVTIRNCFFDLNTSPEKGGAVYMEETGARFESCILSNNQTENGTGSSKGGAVHLKNANYTLLDVHFIKNQALVGGALYTDNSSLTIDKCDFKDNSSHAGGGAMVCHKSGMINLKECMFENNRAGGSGGGVALLEAMWARFTNCNFIGNISASDEYLADGGGVMVTPYDNYVFFVNCEFSNNSAEDYGGGAYLTSITQLGGCLFNNNLAGTDSSSDAGGGAIALSEAAFPILNCTFSGNAGGPGTTIYCEDAAFTLINSIIYDDHNDPDPKIFMSTFEDAPTAYIDHCAIEGGNGVIRGTGPYVVDWASGNISADPLFKVPGENFRLSDESPCIDTARSDTLILLIPNKDLDGNPRIFRGEIDMGCYENQFPFGIPEQDVPISILIYPNPASDHIYIQSYLPEDIHGQLIISDISGRILSSRMVHLLKGERINQSISGLSPGIYLLNLVLERKVYSQKLVIN